jgi:hypothetical protein
VTCEPRPQTRRHLQRRRETTWARDARDLTREIRLFAEDATMPSGERLHARVYLRKMICRRLRELDARIDALVPATTADEPAPETKPGGAR